MRANGEPRELMCRKRNIAGSALLLSILAGCGDDPLLSGAITCDPLLQSYTAAPTDTVTLESGLRYVELRVGAGPDQADWGNFVRVNYSGYSVAGERLIASPPRRCTLRPQPVEQ